MALPAPLSLFQRNQALRTTVAVREPTSANWHLHTSRYRLLLLWGLAIFGTLGLARLVFDYEFLPIIAIAGIVVLAVLVARPRVGFYATFGSVVLFESLRADPLMLPGDILDNSLQSRFGISGANFSPLEMLLLLLSLLFLVRTLASGTFHFSPRPLFFPMLAFTGMLVFGVARGAMGGGNLNISLWESRFLFYMIITYFIAGHLVKSIKDVQRITLLFMVLTALYAVEGVFRYFVLVEPGKLGVAPEFAFGHEVPVFLDSFVMLMLAQAAFGTTRAQKWIGIIGTPIVLTALFASGRRAGQMGLIIDFLVLAIIWLFTHRKAFLYGVVPVVIFGAIYTPVFWNSTGLIGQPARAVKSLYQPDPRDAASNEYRDLEKLDVQATILGSPITGIGFGQPFTFAVPLPDLSWWPFWHYEPHHNILWIWMKTGILGFIAFWVLMGSAIAQAANIIRTSRVSAVRNFAVLAMMAIVSTLVFSYVDLGFVNGRVTFLLGTLMGVLSVLPTLAGPPPAPTPSRQARVVRAERASHAAPPRSAAAPVGAR